VIAVTAVQVVDVLFIVIGAAGFGYFGIYKPVAFVRRTRNEGGGSSQRWHLVSEQIAALARELARSGLAAVVILTLALLTGWGVVWIFGSPIIAAATAMAVVLVAVRFARKRNAARQP
jgi:hypothetical protein